MSQFLTSARAINISLLMLTTVLFVHVLVLVGVVPYTAVWGGRIESQEQMQVSEMISIVSVMLMMWVLAMKSRRLSQVIPEKVLDVIIWAMAVLFGLNTLGNFLSENIFEKVFFTPLTLLLMVLCVRIVRAKSE
jgi:hypothetical protein